MKIFNLPRSLFQILANTNSEGKVLWSSPIALVSDSADSPEKLATKFLDFTPLFSTDPNFLTQDYLEKLDPHVELDRQNDEQYVCSFNTLSYFGLPNENIMEEMKSLASFFVIVKNYNKEYFSHFPTDFDVLSLHVAVSPKQPEEGSLDVTKCFSLVSQNEELTEDQKDFLKSATKHIQSTLKKDPYLMQFANHYVAMLQHTNNYAWSNNTTETFFRPETNPLNKNICNHAEEYKVYLKSIKSHYGVHK